MSSAPRGGAQFESTIKFRRKRAPVAELESSAKIMPYQWDTEFGVKKVIYDAVRDRINGPSAILGRA